MPRMNIPIHRQYTCMYYVTSKKSVHKPGQTFNRKINIAAHTHIHTHTPAHIHDTAHRTSLLLSGILVVVVVCFGGAFFSD